MSIEDKQRIGKEKLEWIKQAFKKRDFSNPQAVGIDLRSQMEKQFDALPAPEESRKPYAW